MREWATKFVNNHNGKATADKYASVSDLKNKICQAYAGQGLVRPEGKLTGFAAVLDCQCWVGVLFTAGHRWSQDAS